MTYLLHYIITDTADYKIGQSLEGEFMGYEITWNFDWHQIFNSKTTNQKGSA